MVAGGVIGEQGVWGTEVSQRGPGAEPPLGVWAKPPKAIGKM